METADSCDTDDDDEGARGGRVLPEQPKRLMGGSFPVLFVAAAIFVTRARGGGAIALARRRGVRGVCDGDVRCIIQCSHDLSDAPSSYPKFQQKKSERCDSNNAWW